MIPFNGLSIDWDNVYVPQGEEILPFQKGGTFELCCRKNVLLGDEMGLGKTIQLIMYMNITRPTQVLIVCPNHLRLNLESELKKWLDPELLEKYGEIEHCSAAAFFPAPLVICNYESFVKWANVLKKVEWDLLVFDEAHYLKNRSAKRTQAAYLFQDVKCKKILMTGTPILNYPYEIFPLIHWLDAEQWPSAAAFERRYYPGGNKYGYNLKELQDFLRNGTVRREIRKVPKIRVVPAGVGKQENVYICDDCEKIFDNLLDCQVHVADTAHTVSIKKIMTEKIKAEKYEVEELGEIGRAIGLMVRRLKKEVLPELPKKRRRVLELPAEGELLDLVEKENELWRKNQEIAEKLMSIFASDDTHESFEDVVEKLKFTKRYFFDEIAIIRHKLARAKVPYVVEHLEDVFENGVEKVVLFIHHRDVAEAFLEHFGDKAVLVYGGMSNEDAFRAKEKFCNDPNVTLFIGSLKAAGTGLNLQVAHHVVFAESDWVPGILTQAEDRCHRIGQDQPVLIEHLVANNSMDSKMIKQAINKQKSIRTALDRPIEKIER